MTKKIKVNLGIFLLIGILLISFANATYSSSQVQSLDFSSEQTFEEFESSMCQTGQDFLIQITPFGCTPAVVRSDLLEEQNVPVYCQLGATKINPLIDVEAIDTISFSGEYPAEISGIGFHPARAALTTEEDLSSPILNNIGYVTIVLREQQNASSLPDFVEGTLTAKLNYDIKSSFGIGEVSFYLPELNSEEWTNKYSQYSFWNGEGYLRAESIDEEETIVSIYDSSFKKVASTSLTKGQESGEMFLSGFDCLAGLKLKLEDVENPDTRVKLRIDGDVVELIEGEVFLENKCKIKSFENNGLNQKVSINCKEDEGVSIFNLEIKPKLRININDVEGDYEVGDILYEFEDGSDKRIFLGYFGEAADGRQFIIPVVSKKHTKEDFLNSAIYQQLPAFTKTILYETGIGVLDVFKSLEVGVYGSALIVTNSIVTGSYPLQMYARESEGSALFDFTTIFSRAVDLNLVIPNIEFVGFSVPENKALDAKTQDYFQKAFDNYNTILESFSSEKYYDEITYGKEVLSKKIVLSAELEQKEIVVELCEEFKDKYSTLTDEIKNYCEYEYKLSSSETASRSVLINTNSKKITFEGIYEPSLNELSVEVFVKGVNEDYSRIITSQKNEKIYVSENEFISLKELKESSAVFDISSIDGSNLNSVEVNLKDYKFIGKNNYQIRVDEINLKKTAKVSITPNIPESGTQANFSFKIGIEKRAIELSPEKTKETIQELNETITKWTEISNSLGQTVKTLKTACLGTGAALTVKNFLLNAGGDAIARQNVMRGEGGWYEKCTDLVSVGNYNSIDKCMLENAEEIDNEVELWSNAIDEQNSQIKKLQSEFTENKFLSEDVVDTDEFMKEYTKDTQEYLEDNLGDIVNDPDGVAPSINTEEVTKIFSYNAWKDNKYSLEQLREIELYTKVLESDSGNEIAQKRLYSSLAEVKTVSESYANQANWADELNILATQIDFLEIGKTSKSISYEGLTNGDLAVKISSIEEDNPIGVVQTSDGGKYILVLDESTGTDILPIKRDGDNLMIYGSSGVLLSSENIPAEFRTVYFKKYDSTSYENNFKSSFGENEPVVKYYETEPYQGLPAIVPFDLDNGWYAATKQTSSVLGGISSYDESGRVTSFWLCNVGQNGIEEFSSLGDDICQQINLGTGQPYNQFSGLTEDEALKRVEAGQKAIEQASNQYKSEVSRVNINVGYGNINLNVGSPAVGTSDMQCQDFMSPKDCQLLFNVCDPVICPSSRCDLGGAYPVQDVVQSGIIGSIALCFPNIQEGIYIPICLSGLQAGIDGLLSISTSYRDCLQESLETGQMVGACDEIYSIYMCEFFWRQALPLAQVALPKIVESLLGQNVRGGGEYLGVESAFNNAEDSVAYFTQYYGENSFNAFQSRTSEDVGGEICQSYISGVYTDGATLIDSLTDPDSPAQFHGRFDEIPFTTVIVPATSQYKVFYHIYAGKDAGAYYQVYLKGTPDTSFYQDVSSSRMVASGYIPAGSYASETKDFTAPSGYQEMCIVVNNQEECGFAQVSTDFAVDYITEKYVEEQASQTDITSESECISGSASIYSLLNPNLQEGIDELVDPEIYNQGITRVCATANPGEGTDPYAGGEDSRWVEVGYCDDENIKCWLDTQSVEEVIKNTNIEEDVLEVVSENQLDILRNEQGYLSSADVESLINDIQESIDNFNFEEAIEKVDQSLEFVFLNSEKANLFLLRGEAYSYLATNKNTVEDRSLRTFSEGEISTTTEEEDSDLESESIDTSATTNIETSEETEETQSIISEKGNQIYQEAIQFRGSRVGQLDFVTNSLNNAGIKINSFEDFDLLVKELDNREDFIEVDSSKMQKGDLVLFGNGCDRKKIAIFEKYSEDKDKVFIYTNFESGFNLNVKEFEFNFISTLEDSVNYFYRVYRYSDDLSVSDIESIQINRFKWDIDSAIEQLDLDLKRNEEENGGKYSDNKFFVDNLILEGLLTEEECDFIRGTKWFNFRFGEKDLLDLKKILTLKKALSGQT